MGAHVQYSDEQQAFDREPRSDQGWMLRARDDSPLAGQTFELKGIMVLGRQSTCELVIADECISRRHAQFTNQNGVLLVQDLESTNGTHINGQRRMAATLRHGDVINFEQYTFDVIQIAGVQKTVAHSPSDPKEERTVLMTSAGVQSAPPPPNSAAEAAPANLGTTPPEPAVEPAPKPAPEPAKPAKPVVPKETVPEETEIYVAPARRSETEVVDPIPPAKPAAAPVTEVPIAKPAPPPPIAPTSTADSYRAVDATDDRPSLLEDATADYEALQRHAPAADPEEPNQPAVAPSEGQAHSLLSQETSELPVPPTAKTPVTAKQPLPKEAPATPPPATEIASPSEPAAPAPPVPKPEVVRPAQVESPQRRESAPSAQPLLEPAEKVGRATKPDNPVLQIKEETLPEPKPKSPVRPAPIVASQQAAQPSPSKAEVKAKPNTGKGSGKWWERQESGPDGTVFFNKPEDLSIPKASLQASVTAEVPCLVGLSAPFTGTIFELQDGKNTIGQADINDIILDEEHVSATHAQIIGSQGSWKVVNLLSSNGTFVNDKKCQTAYLSNGDKIRFGRVRFEFKSPDGMSATPLETDKSSNSSNLLYLSIGFLVTAVVILMGVVFML